MSTSNESYEDSVQIVKDVIDKNLIDKVTVELSASSLPTSKTITTRYKWNAACQQLFECHFNNVHFEVRLEIEYKSYFTDILI